MNPGNKVLYYYLGDIVGSKRILQSVTAKVLEVIPDDPNEALVLDIEWPEDDLVDLESDHPGKQAHKNHGLCRIQSYCPKAKMVPPESGSWMSLH